MNAPVAPAADGPGDRSSVRLSARLRDATRGLHTQVERAGLMARLLRGQLPRAHYVALLRQLHAWYAALEASLARCADDPRLAPLDWAPLVRAAALAHDLEQLAGADWPTLPLLPLAAAQATRLERAGAARDVPLLIAWAYVRYLGDLNGGQMLSRLVAPWHRPLLGARADDPQPTPAFYDFRAAGEVRPLATAFREALDRLPLGAAGQDAVVDAACAAFRSHARLFVALDPAAARPADEAAGRA